jgi:Protein of unknown function (DUF3096)
VGLVPFIDIAKPLQDSRMTLHIEMVPLLSLIAGALILAMPRLLNYVVAFYLILVGALGLMH